MVALRKNWVMTLGGIMVGVGQIPMLIQFAHLSFPLPLWWNSCQFPIFLAGTMGGIIIGIAGKGQDEHSTPLQMEAAAKQADVKQAVADADAAARAAIPAKVIVEQTPKAPGE